MVDGDIRRGMPRFQGENFARNLDLLARLRDIAAPLNLTPAQLCMQWLFSRGEHIVAIPGTTSAVHLAENLATPLTPLDAATMATLDAIFAPENIAGQRYPAATQAEIDTEEFG
jgi:aryl-alcohol dehydrogenase-like predicted oxidoreductase